MVLEPVLGLGEKDGQRRNEVFWKQEVWWHIFKVLKNAYWVLSLQEKTSFSVGEEPKKKNIEDAD